MARGINKAIIIGNLGADPEVRYMPSGGAVANLRIATSEGWKDKQTGEAMEHTEWHRVVLYNRLGEIANEYLRKGSKVYIEGSIRTRKWQDKEGNDRYNTEIIGREMQMLDSRGAGAGAGSIPDAGAQSTPNEFENTSKPQSSNVGAEPAATTADEFNDDVPF